MKLFNPVIRFFRFLSGKKKQANTPKRPKRLADVLDGNLRQVVRIWSIGQVAKTGLLLFAVTAMIFSSWADDFKDAIRDKHVAVIKIQGEINEANNGTGYAAAKAFKQAIKDDKSAAILFSVSSGGGSPTQGELLYTAINDYVSSAPIEKRKPVYVSIAGTCASACYYAMSPADSIFAHYNSLVGSIGVRMDAFDVRGLAEKLGVDRVTLASGENKTILDPFRGVSESDRDNLMREIIQPLYSKFVSDIVSARDGKLAVDNEQIFSGMVYPGAKGKTLGFVDDIKTTLQSEQYIIDNTDGSYVKVVNQPGFSFSRMLKSAFESAIEGALKEEGGGLS